MLCHIEGTEGSYKLLRVCSCYVGLFRLLCWTIIHFLWMCIR